jgi:UDP-N-acetylglucosamine 4,6-dehydratase
MLNNASVLVTGGTGSFGRKFVEIVLDRFPKIKRLIVFSRDELKQYEMAQAFPEKNFNAIRYFLGDVRDYARLVQALEGVDVVIHAAALKQVPAAEYNPFEFIKTNVIGAENLIQACLNKGVKRVVALSTDKAAAPLNLYGATKLCSDKLFVAANNIRGNRDIKFSVVRYGNVIGSRGSVMPLFLERRKTKVIPITDVRMTRFNITLNEGVDMVLWALENAIGGEIFVPKLPSYKITDVATAVGPECEIELIGMRPGEKVHEEMITESDSSNTVDLGKYYVILPSSTLSLEKYRYKNITVAPVPDGFSYNSGSNPNFLTVDELRELIRKNIDPKL